MAVRRPQGQPLPVAAVVVAVVVLVEVEAQRARLPRVLLLLAAGPVVALRSPTFLLLAQSISVMALRHVRRPLLVVVPVVVVEVRCRARTLCPTKQPCTVRPNTDSTRSSSFLPLTGRI